MRWPRFVSWVFAARVIIHTTIVTNQKFQRQPLATVRKPPIMGPMHGPMAVLEVSFISNGSELITYSVPSSKEPLLFLFGVEV
jgi:hypothetical protein